MKNLIYLCLLAVTTNAAELIKLDKKFVHALGWVESRNNPSAVGDSGRAVGEFQIWKSYWSDAIEYAPEIGGEYKDCYNSEYALKIITSYFNRYAKEAIRKNDFETLSKLHNGGPSWRKKSTDVQNKLNSYWGRVKNQLDGVK